MVGVSSWSAEIDSEKKKVQLLKCSLACQLPGQLKIVAHTKHTQENTGRVEDRQVLVNFNLQFTNARATKQEVSSFRWVTWGNGFVRAMDF